MIKRESNMQKNVNSEIVGPFPIPKEKYHPNVNRAYLKGVEDIRSAIGRNENPEFFIELFNKLMTGMIFSFMNISQSEFFRGRLFSRDELLSKECDLKYPPLEFAKKGRLNNDGESIAYLSNQIYGPIIEIDIDFYQILYNATYILNDKSNLLGHMIGMKSQYYSENTENANGLIEFYNLTNELLTSPDKSYYNATIGLAKHILGRKFSNMPNHNIALIYNSAQEHKTNNTVHNLAVTPEVFDRFFVLKEVQCQIMHLIPDEAVNIDVVNQGIPDGQGNILWEKNLSRMLKDVELKFGNDCFYTDDSKSRVISYPYGYGSVISKNDSSLVVEFKNYGSKEIPLNTIRLQ